LGKPHRRDQEPAVAASVLGATAAAGGRRGCAPMRGRLAPLLLFSAAFAGCVRFGQPAPHLRDFRLAYPPPPIGGAPLPATIRVSSLRVATIYDRLAIVHRENDYETIPSYYDRWSANPGSLVADLLARDLVDSGLYRAVERGPTLVPADYQLSGEILEI